VSVYIFLQHFTPSHIALGDSGNNGATQDLLFYKIYAYDFWAGNKNPGNNGNKTLKPSIKA